MELQPLLEKRPDLEQQQLRLQQLLLMDTLVQVQFLIIRKRFPAVELTLKPCLNVFCNFMLVTIFVLY